MPGAASGVEANASAVKQQLAQENSLLNTYRRLIKIRHQNPEIARGDIEEVVDFKDTEVGAYIINYDGSRVLIIHNAGEEAKKPTVDMVDKPEMRGWSTVRVTAVVDNLEVNTTKDDNKVTPKRRKAQHTR